MDETHESKREWNGQLEPYTSRPKSCLAELREETIHSLFLTRKVEAYDITATCPRYLLLSLWSASEKYKYIGDTRKTTDICMIGVLISADSENLHQLLTYK